MGKFGFDTKYMDAINRNKTVKIVIATHKEYQMPLDMMYVPLHVGAENAKDIDGKFLSLGFQKDNDGENISVLNPSFCELTGLFWAWKNLDADYIGLVHYRRHFGLKKGKPHFDKVLSYAELLPFLSNIKIFVPKKRKYYIETLYSHYAHTHYGIQLDMTRKIIAERFSMYISSYDHIIKQKSGYMFNMLIMEREWLDSYCSWLFDILFELKNRINMNNLSTFQARFYGRISEIIFNVWLDYQIKTEHIRKEEIMELPCIYTEKINWLKKGFAFLKAKLFGAKYEGSF